MFSGNRRCYRKTRSADDVHTKANASIMLLCAAWYANEVNEAPIVSNVNVKLLGKS